MSSIMSIATSGILAASRAIEVSASNVANANTTGPMPQSPPGVALPPRDGERGVYQALEAVNVSLGNGGGVRADVAPRLPAYVPRYEPSSPDANADGLIAAPNVDYAMEIGDQIGAMAAFQANLKVLSVADEMSRAVIDLVR